MNKDEMDPLQKQIAAGLGVSEEAYAARAWAGVAVRLTAETWLERWYLRFAWRPDNKPRELPPADYDNGAAAERDLAHNQAILASIRLTPPVSFDPADPLDVVARLYRREGMAIRFLGTSRMSVEGMRGWAPVFDELGQPVMVNELMMVERPAAEGEARAAYQAEAANEAIDEPSWSQPGGHGDGDIFRLTWGVPLFRGVFAFYRFTNREQKKRRGLELMTQRRDRAPNSIRLGFYRRGE